MSTRAFTDLTGAIVSKRPPIASATLSTLSRVSSPQSARASRVSFMMSGLLIAACSYSGSGDLHVLRIQVDAHEAESLHLRRTAGGP